MKKIRDCLLCDVHWKNIVAVVAFTTGGIFIGRTLWELTRHTAHPVLIIIIGFVLIVLGGMLLHSFDEKR